MLPLVLYFVFLSTVVDIKGIKSEKLSCWTLNVTADRKSYLYYYRGEPGEFVNGLLTNQSKFTLPRVKFNSSAYVLGAVAADNNQPISLFVHDKISGGIYRFEDNLRSLQPVFKGSSVMVEDIAVDWVSQNIYYTDPLVGVGLVSYTKHFRIIIHKVAALHGIDVDPLSRMIFYADGDAGYIYQATLTGDNHQVLTGAKTTNPTALVVDAVSKVLYWLDEGTQYLQSWNYVNSEFKKIWNSYKVGVGVFTGIDIYEPYLFVSLKNEQRMKVIRTNGTEVMSFRLLNGKESRSYGITISTPERKPHRESLCGGNDGGCQHICIHQSNVARKCLCQFGYKSEGDFCKTESLDDNFLLVADSSSNILYQVDVNTNEFHALCESSSFSGSFVNFAYHPAGQNVYWTERNRHRIWEMNLVNRKPAIFTDLGSGSALSSLAIDMPNGYLYYTDTKLKRISRIILDSKKNEVVLQLQPGDKPTYLQLDASQRFMYWTDSGTNLKIERANMDDGTNRKVLVSRGLRLPSGLALDLGARYLYWIDELVKVSRMDLSTSEAELFVVTSGKFNGMALDDRFLYLAGQRAITKIGKEDRNVDKIGPEYFLLTSGVSAYSSSNGSSEIDRKQKVIIGTNLIIIIGVAVGGIVLLAIIIAVVVACVKRRNRGPSGSSDAQSRHDDPSDHYQALTGRRGVTDDKKPRAHHHLPPGPKRTPPPPQNPYEMQPMDDYLSRRQ